MDNRVTRILVWTAILASFLFFVDRVLFGPAIRENWLTADSLAHLPPPANPGIRLPPAYLPGSMAWPPARIIYRLKPSPGWWLGIQETPRTDISLWIGTGEYPLPQELEPLLPCTSETMNEKCPPEWRFSSAKHKTQTLFVFSRIGGEETKRILLGLERH